MKDVCGYEGLYKVDENGNVFSVRNNKLLKRMMFPSGYEYVHLCNGKGKTKLFRVHRLVASAFIPNPNNYPVINHIDENPSNNCVSNLEWCSKSYNTKYSVHKRSQKVMCNGVEFPSIKALSRYLNTDSKSLRYRLKVGGLYKGKYKITIS